HFEARDIWQSANPKRLAKPGWLGRAAAEFKGGPGEPLLHRGRSRLPLAPSGLPGSRAVTVNGRSSLPPEISRSRASQPRAGRRGTGALAAPGARHDGVDLEAVVRGRQVQTLTAVETLRELLEGPGSVARGGDGLGRKLQLVAGLIARGFGRGVFYARLDGFDTHADQGPAHARLLGELAASIGPFFAKLKETGDDRRVRLLTFSEFGRRVNENGSRGTDHGAASCLFVAGPSVRGGVVGRHPSLKDLDVGDLKFHTDFRRVYATQLDSWLGCDCKAVLGEEWAQVKELE